jgi:RHS repeat-associated protein
LGNNREVWRASSKTTIQRTQYYASGLPWETVPEDNLSLQPYKYNGKEFIEMHGYDTYDYGARGYYAAMGRFTTVDPLAEKYYSISPYSYCGGNPVNRIDPDGMDIWNINEKGVIVSRKNDTKQDKITAVNSEGKTKQNKEGNDVSISFKHGTIKTVSLKYKESEDGPEKKMDFFKVKGDDNGNKLFEFLAKPNETTNVEWSHAKVGNKEGDNATNFIGTSNEKASTGAGDVINSYNYTIRVLDHNHPGGNYTPSPHDLDNRDRYLQNNPNMKVNIYSNGRYRPYTTLQDLINPYWTNKIYKTQP